MHKAKSSLKAEILQRLRSAGITRPSIKRLQQHFLIALSVIEAQLKHAELRTDDVVIEVGAGLGILTERLADRVSKVIAIEYDPKLARFLTLHMPPNVEVIEADVLSLTLPKFNAVVANIPYNISSPLTFKLLEHEFRVAVLLYQLEFAERLIAKPGTKKYSRLSLSVYYRAECELLMTIPPSAFYPKPKVNSALIKLKRRQIPPFTVEDEKLFFTLLKIAFSHRRKKLKHALLLNWQSLLSSVSSTRTTTKLNNFTEFKSIVYDLPFIEARAECLTPEQFCELANILIRKLKS